MTSGNRCAGPGDPGPAAKGFRFSGKSAACQPPFRIGQKSVSWPATSAWHNAGPESGAVMASTVDELTIRYEEDGIETVRELDKQILTRGAWSTVIFRYQDWDRSKEAYGPDKYSIRRYQKRNGEYQQKSKFNISSKDQAEKIIAALQGWIK
jgi:hypothetical protein